MRGDAPPRLHGDERGFKYGGGGERTEDDDSVSLAHPDKRGDPDDRDQGESKRQSERHRLAPGERALPRTAARDEDSQVEKTAGEKSKAREITNPLDSFSSTPDVFRDPRHRPKSDH